MSLTTLGSTPQPSLAWQFESSNVDYVTSLSPVYSTTDTTTTYLPTYESAKYNLGMRLRNNNSTNSNTWLRYTFTNSIPIDSGVTLMAWLKYTSFLAANSAAATLYDSTIPAFCNTLSIGMQSTSVLGYNNPSATYSSFLTPNAIGGTYTTGTWYHVAVTFSSSGIVQYLNGVPGTTKATGTTSLSFTGMRLGTYTNAFNNNSGFAAADCTIDDLRIYNTALSAAQVQSIYAAQGMPSRGVQTGLNPSIPQVPVATIYGNQISPSDASTSKPTTSVTGQTTYSNTSSQYTQFGSGIALTPVTTGVTVSMVLTFNNGVFFTENLFYFGGNGNYQISARVATFDALAFQIWDSSGARFISYNPPFTPVASWSTGVKYYFTFVLSPSSTQTVTVSVYVNGVLNGSGSGTSAATALNNGTYTTATVGANNNGAYANMTVYHFSVLNAALTASQISALYQRQLANSTYQITTPLALSGTPLFSQLSSAATSSAVGAFSLRAVNGTTAKAVQVQPRVALPSMSSAAASIGSNAYSQSLTSGYPFGLTGTYVATGSSIYSGTTQPWRAFDSDTSTWWETTANMYTGTPGTTYSGTQTTTVGGVAKPGEWLQIQLPTAIVLASYSMYARLNWTVRMPYNWIVAGSNDGTTWTAVDTQTGIGTWTGQTPISFNVTSSTAYTYFRLVVSAITDGAGAQNTNIGQWTLIGGPPQDFYADRLGNLLTAPVTGQTLANWLGGATGNVTTWYDQSGQGNHATGSGTIAIYQTSNVNMQWAIQSSGNLLTVTSPFITNTNFTIHSITRRTTSSQAPGGGGTAPGNQSIYAYTPGTGWPGTVAYNRITTLYGFQGNRMSFNSVNTSIAQYPVIGNTGCGLYSTSGPVDYLAVIWNGTTTQMYYNNSTSATTAAATFGNIPNTNNFYLLGCPAFGAVVGGEFGEVIVFNSALSASDIATLYSAR